MERDLSVKVCGLQFKNPVTAASGTFGFGLEMAQFYDINCLGSFSMKGTTLYPRFGNPTPRIAECASGMLNAVGLQNPGVDHVIEHELVELKKVFHDKVIANISGFSIEEYVECAKKFDKAEQVGILEINISCPNVKHGGMSFGTCPDSAFEVTKAVKAVTTKPVFIKLSPNVTNIVEIAKACEEAGADGISLINTLLGTRIDNYTGKPMLANIVGGVSGPCIKPIALRMVYEVYKNVRIPILGMGGLSSGDDVIEMMSAGASLVAIGAENCRNPYACKEIIDSLPGLMEKYGINRLEDIIGRAHK